MPVGTNAALLLLSCLLNFPSFIVSVRFETKCGDDYSACRKRLISATFGQPNLPSRPPKWIKKEPFSPTVNPNNRTALIWEVSDPYGPTLNATVYWTLNSTGHEPRNWDPQAFHPSRGGEWKWPKWPNKRPSSRTLVLYHNGHETGDSRTNFDGVTRWLTTLGFDSFEFDMPLYGWNRVKDVPMSHSWFEQYELLGAHCMRYFVEPVILATDYALSHLGYERVIMIGLSGGGWTTTYAAALDKRIEMSFPVAGGVPFSMRTILHSSWDWEQEGLRPVYSVATFLDWMVLGGWEDNRAQLQILHEMDSCCFCGCGREKEILSYNQFVQARVHGGFRTAITVGNIHEVNERDKALAGFLGGLPAAKDAMGYFTDASLPLPFDQLYSHAKKKSTT